MPNRHVLVVFGGDICDVIKPQDIRFDINDLPDWMLEGKAIDIKERLNNIAKAQIKHAVKIFGPLKPYVLGSIEANHGKVVRKRYNHDTHEEFCERMGGTGGKRAPPPLRMGPHRFAVRFWQEWVGGPTPSASSTRGTVGSRGGA